MRLLWPLFHCSTLCLYCWCDHVVSFLSPPERLVLMPLSYCLFLAPTLWNIIVSNDLRACSSALFVMAERTPVVKKYRDALAKFA